MILTAIVIDDSPLQRMMTNKLVKENPNLQFIESFNDPETGLEAIHRIQPDVVFLDVEMPKLNGFEFLENLNHDCQVILNSTRSQFALTAFQYDQVKDFMTKPMNQDRFEKSVERMVKKEHANQKKVSLYSVPVYQERLRKAS